MTGPIDLLLLAGTLALAVPSAVFVLECALAIAFGRRTSAPATGPVPRFAVLIPAHDESAGIGATLAALVPELAGDPRQRIVVIADNCSDDTAAVARAAGVEVIERTDPERRGKGYALGFGTDHLALDPPEVVLVVDADCRVSQGALATLAMLAHVHSRPVQGEYLMAATEPSAASAVSALAFLVKNQVRPRGFLVLGLPCQLTGTGMAFPWPLWRDAPRLGSDLVEDMVLGVEFTLRRAPPLLAPAAQISSVLPDQQKAALGQRRRWEHGHLQTLVRHGPRLLLRGLFSFNPSAFALGLDLIVPPLAFLVLLLLAATAATAAATLLLHASPLPLFIASGALTTLGLTVLAAWATFGRRTIPARHLLSIPLYVLWKIPLYAAFLLRRSQKTWDRTARAEEKKP